MAHLNLNFLSNKNENNSSIWEGQWTDYLFSLTYGIIKSFSLQTNETLYTYEFTSHIAGCVQIVNFSGFYLKI